MVVRAKPYWPQAEIYKQWENALPVVQWDQRGPPARLGAYREQHADVSLDHIIQGRVELAPVSLPRARKKKIIVLGTHGGPSSPPACAMRRSLAAYVGTGQVASWMAMVNIQYDLLLAKARRDGNQAIVKSLRPSAAPPDQRRSLHLPQQNTIFAQLWRSLRSGWPCNTAAQVRRPELDSLEQLNCNSKTLKTGMQFTGEHVLPDQLATNLPKMACQIHTPTSLSRGRRHHQSHAGPPLTIQGIKAPKKELILIPTLAHFAFYDRLR